MTKLGKGIETPSCFDKYIPLLTILMGCYHPHDHPIHYPWGCGVQDEQCYLMGVEVHSDDPLVTAPMAKQMCSTGVKVVVPDHSKHTSLIVCK